MKKFEKVRKNIIKRTIEDLTQAYIEIVKEVNYDIDVNEKLIKKYVEFCLDPELIYDPTCCDYSLTIKENVENYFENLNSNSRSLDLDADYWLDWNTPEELYQIGIENNLIKECDNN